MQAADHLQTAQNYLNEAMRTLPSDPHTAVSNTNKLTSLASDHIDKALALDPKATIIVDGVPVDAEFLIADALKMQGTVEARHGPYKAQVVRGMDAIRKALKYRPHSAELHLSLAIGYLRLEQGGHAQKYLDKTIELDPTHHYAHQLRDGSTHVASAQKSDGEQYLTNILTDKTIWLNLIGFGIAGYFIYQLVYAFNNATGDFLYYLICILSFLGVMAAWRWLMSKFE